MDPASIWQIVIMIVLICFSAFFSMSETALTSLSKIRLRNMVDENVKGAKTVSKLVENQGKLLSCILVGNNLVNIMTSSIATILCQRLFGNNALAIATGAATFVILVFGEITPKTLASQNSEKISLIVAKPISIVLFILTPVVFFLNAITGVLIKLFGGDPNKPAPAVTEAEIKTLVNVGHEEGVLEIDERKMINNVFDFGDTFAKDVMTPRTDISAADIKATNEELLLIFERDKFSRIPIFEENVDNIIGILHFKDFIFAKNTNSNFSLKNYLREPYFTYESKPTTKLFSIMRNKRFSVAVVLDEYGGTSGIVTLEDLIEEIVGEIDDEYDEPNEEIKCITEDEYIVDGAAKIDDVNEMIGTRLESDDFDSIGGFVVGQLGRFPEKGEIIEADGGSVKFTIETVDKNRIVKMKINT